MKLHSRQLLDLVDQGSSFEKAADKNLPFPIAKLIDKMLGVKFAGDVHRGGTNVSQSISMWTNQMIPVKLALKD